MTKDTYYFSHDYNARNDKKISALVREYKSAGYGIFWATAEMLHEEGGEIELDELTLSAISKDLNEDFDLVKSVIEKCISSFKLFCLSSDNILTANRVRRNLDKRNEISKKRSDAGKAGANAKQMQANAEQKQAKEIKEIKEINNPKVEIPIVPLAFQKKQIEDMVVQEMMKVWKTHNPSYYEEPELDYSACLEMAYKIAKMKKWRKEEVLNGKMPDTLMSWGKIVVFVKYDNFLKRLSLSNLNSQWQNIVQKMSATPDEPKFEKETITSVKKEAEVDFDKYKRK